MKNFKYFVLVILILGCAQACAKQIDLNDSNQKEIRYFKEVLWPQAYKNGDTKLLDEMLHESFQFVQNDGSVSNKAKELEYLKTSKWSPKSFRYAIERLEVFQSKFAVVSGRGYGVSETGISYSYYSSNHLVKQDGRWQAISSHVSGYKEE